MSTARLFVFESWRRILQAGVMRATLFFHADAQTCGKKFQGSADLELIKLRDTTKSFIYLTTEFIFLTRFFDAHTTLFNLFGYSMSYLEFFAVLSGLVSVWLSAKANIWSWPIGIINVILAFFLYYQVQLYPDMFLQVFFGITNVIGWWRWTHPKATEKDKSNELKVSYMRPHQLFLTVAVGIAGTIVTGYFASQLHHLFPSVFSIPGSFPYIDSFIMVMSIVSTFLMIQKKIECWIIWISIDVIAALIYYVKGVKLFSMEYLIFTGLACYGLWQWIRIYKSYTTKAA